MAISGQRFDIDLDPGPDLNERAPQCDSSASIVGDIIEHIPPVHARIPTPPRLRPQEAGFPTHKKRSRPHASNRYGKDGESHQGPDGDDQPSRHSNLILDDALEPNTSNERQEIDLENKERLAKMSTKDIVDAKSELMANLSPSLIERLLKKASIEDTLTAEEKCHEVAVKERAPQPKKPNNKKLTFEDTKSTSSGQSSIASSVPQHQSKTNSSHSPKDSNNTASQAQHINSPEIHFPKPLTPPALDPSDPNFLSDLHSIYFPSLPSDPNALSWMKPLDASESESYDPSLENILPSALRFDFKGHLIPPRLALQIPTTEGLHHHASAPQAAGYTIPELAHLSRSSFPAQRCVAYQTLGRILFRLGTGVFGPEDHELCQGLWKCIEQGRVLDTLLAEAGRNGESGNRTCWATATDALWLWRKGGGRKFKAT
ncbi:MAG: hypothetical protein LQ351_003971 [Letrouitia transgressa]|nr:MAG: hypothetical protein LQ351_003971 [Letrouitia transgressa]